jgi:putative RNA 2'-phosphotransferase
VNQTDVRLSKFLSYVLRHAPEAIGLALDSEGWTGTEALLDAARRQGVGLDAAKLRQLVSHSDKKRFTLSADGSRIRAAQGHSSAQVDIAFVPLEPPPHLYHGTARASLESIMKDGLVAGRRHYVHLSDDEETAKGVGRRHGPSAILRIDTMRMHRQGHKFHRAENGVWLTRFVPPEFIRQQWPRRRDCSIPRYRR